VLDGLPLPPRLRERLDRINVARAIRGTIGIEGTHLTEAETGEILDSPGPVLGPERAREEQEARNAADVMRFVADSLAGDPGQALTEELVREIQYRTTRGIDYPHNTPGRYREHGVSVGTYFAPDAADVPRLMREFVAWLRSGPARGWPAAIRAIAAHFYLVAIHPFGDGNGRTSRAIESFILYQAGINRLGFYSLANFYYRQRPEYIEMLDRTLFVHDGDLTEFARFALGGLLEELEHVQREAMAGLNQIAFREHARETLRGPGAPRAAVHERRLNLALEAAAGPIPVGELLDGTHRAARFYRGRSSRTISRDLDYLAKAGLLVIDGDVIKANLDVARPPPSDPLSSS
jgi:Fic family protein